MFSSYFSALLYVSPLISGSFCLVNGYKLTISSSTEINLSRIIESVNNTLELTCQVEDNNNGSAITPFWTLPEYNEKRPDPILTDYHNGSMKLTLNKLSEKDNGEYKCGVCVDEKVFKESVYVHVKPSRRCVNSFTCSAQSGICIHHRYVCDGFKDCENGTDEAVSLCGIDPCRGKIRCSDRRCIPTFWCCKSYEPNCTAKVIHPCCPTGPQDEYLFPQNVINNQHYTEMTFLQSAIYTIVGFAMVFMSIVTILMIAICRIHLQRSLISSVPRRQGSIPTSLQCNPRITSHQRSRSDGGNVANSRMLVSYSIPSNGLEIVGDPCQPPPYSEVTPYSDPPPSYIEIFNSRTDEESETSPCLSAEKPPP